MRILRHLAVLVVIVVIQAGGISRAEVLPTPGLSPRSTPATAVVGKRLFVYGGLRPDRGNNELGRKVHRTDGAMVNTRTGRAKKIADAPFEYPLKFPFAVTVGDEVAVVGELCKRYEFTEDSDECPPRTTSVAVYDVDNDSWRAVRVPRSLKTSRRDRTYVSLYPIGATQRAVVFAAEGTNADFVQRSEYWTYSLRNDRWSKLPDHGFRAESHCLLGSELVLLRTKYEERGIVTEGDPMPGGGGSGKFYVEPSLVTIDVSDPSGWRATTADATARYQASPPALECLDDAVMVVGSIFWFDSLRYYDSRQEVWSTPAAAPKPAAMSGPEGTFMATRLWSGTELVFLPAAPQTGKAGLAYNPDANSWRELSGAPAVDRRLHWNGEAIVGYSSESVPTDSRDVQSGVLRYEL